MSRDDTWGRAKALLFTFVGVAIVVTSLASAVSVWRFSARASSAHGVVIRLNAGGSHPQVRFATPVGEVVEYAQNGLIFGYQVGNKVEILYDPQHPSDHVTHLENDQATIKPHQLILSVV